VCRKNFLVLYYDGQVEEVNLDAKSWLLVKHDKAAYRWTERWLAHLWDVKDRSPWLLLLAISTFRPTTPSHPRPLRRAQQVGV
jgi:hypothetical protein